MNVEKNFFKCWICDTSGRSIRRLVRRFGSYQQLKLWDEISGREDITTFDDIFELRHDLDVQQKIQLPEEFVSLTGKNHPPSARHAKKYLESRGITQEDIIRWKIGYCVRGNYEGRIIIPSFSDDGYVNYFVARAYDSNWKKYLNPSTSKDIVFNELFMDWDSDVILVEGAFDAIKAGPNSIPLLGSTLRDHSRLFRKIVEKDAAVFLALDADAEKKTIKIITELLNYGVEIYKIDTTGHTDAGEMTKEEFKQRKDNATFIGDKDYLFYQAMGMN